MYSLPFPALKRVASIATISVATCLFAGSAQAEVIDFEDVLAVNDFEVPAGYKGFTWSGSWGAQSWVLAQPNENDFSAHSGTNYVWANGTSSLTLAGSVFDLNGMWAFVASSNPTEEFVAHGFLNGVEIYTQTLALPHNTYSELTLNFMGIDSLRFDAMAGNLVIDDITVNAAPSVPESSSCLALFCFAIAGLVAVRRRIVR